LLFLSALFYLLRLSSLLSLEYDLPPDDEDLERDLLIYAAYSDVTSLGTTTTSSDYFFSSSFYTISIPVWGSAFETWATLATG
jgi:hypothetical protein